MCAMLANAVCYGADRYIHNFCSSPHRHLSEHTPLPKSYHNMNHSGLRNRFSAAHKKQPFGWKTALRMGSNRHVHAREQHLTFTDLPEELLDNVVTHLPGLVCLRSSWRRRDHLHEARKTAPRPLLTHLPGRSTEPMPHINSNVENHAATPIQDCQY
jgi:hypothetical protein